MTTAALALQGPRPGLISPIRSSAQSESAERLGQLSEQIRKHLLDSVAVRAKAEAALQELEAACGEAAVEGWNGFGAKAVDPRSYEKARLLIGMLPTTSPFPEVTIDGDGEVALDWLFGPRRALSVSVGGNGRLTFAWMNGHRTFRGVDWLDDGIPATIAFAVADLARHGRA